MVEIALVAAEPTRKWSHTVKILFITQAVHAIHFFQTEVKVTVFC